MLEKAVYTAAVVAVAWAVTFGLRSLPFLLFAGRSRDLPPSVERFGAFVSPVIIAGLIVYSYSALEWRTAWPYLAGALTVALQLWKGNPLASIIAGTALYMSLLGFCGCATSTVAYEQDISHPLLHVTRNGMKFMDEYVTPEEAVGRLEKGKVPKDVTIYVQVDEDFDDQRALWVFKNNYLSRAGYTRSAWVHRRRAESGSADKVDRNLNERKIPFEGRTIRPEPGKRIVHTHPSANP